MKEERAHEMPVATRLRKSDKTAFIVSILDSIRRNSKRHDGIAGASLIVGGVRAIEPSLPLNLILYTQQAAPPVTPTGPQQQAPNPSYEAPLHTSRHGYCDTTDKAGYRSDNISQLTGNTCTTGAHASAEIRFNHGPPFAYPVRMGNILRAPALSSSETHCTYDRYNWKITCYLLSELLTVHLTFLERDVTILHTHPPRRYLHRTEFKIALMSRTCPTGRYFCRPVSHYHPRYSNLAGLTITVIFPHHKELAQQDTICVGAGLILSRPILESHRFFAIPVIFPHHTEFKIASMFQACPTRHYLCRYRFDTITTNTRISPVFLLFPLSPQNTICVGAGLILSRPILESHRFFAIPVIFPHHTELAQQDTICVGAGLILSRPILESHRFFAIPVIFPHHTEFKIASMFQVCPTRHYLCRCRFDTITTNTRILPVFAIPVTFPHRTEFKIDSMFQACPTGRYFCRPVSHYHPRYSNLVGLTITVIFPHRTELKIDSMFQACPTGRYFCWSRSHTITVDTRILPRKTPSREKP
ncbi:hypothetical protein J6590_036814 [Homalodisca vitripennis]|nr:hypothetical protein J6590_036814 [Homalodisca vitripennis]